MPPINVQDIINQTNQYRVEQKLPPLQLNDKLTQAAQYRADDMAKTGSFSHNVATTTDMKKHYNFIKSKGYNYKATGENLARDFNNATDVVNAWKASPTHNKNLLDKDFKDIGLAVVPGTYQGKPTYFVVQFFGSQNGQPIMKTVAQAPTKQIAQRLGTQLQFRTQPPQQFNDRMAMTTPRFRTLK